MRNKIVNFFKDSSENGYRTAFKATSLFGGVQVVTILIGIAKSKLVAVWLGTAGYGIMSLFNAGVSLISSISNLGLQSSAVRDIAAANGENDQSKLSQIVKAIDRWVIATGLIGALLTICLSPWLSEWLFESDKYTVSFVLLSSVVFLNGLYNQHFAILQGTRRLRLMASANIFGALAGFVCSVPFFYFFRESGIVWALVLTAFSTTVISFLYAKKVKIIHVNQNYRESFRLGSNSVKLGIMMSVTVIAVYLVEFILKTYITNYGGLQDVGLYQAGWSLNAQYLGLVFTAMAKDYFPRLSESSDNNAVISSKMNQQAEITVLILAPMIVVMIVFLSFIIKLLYSGEFMDIIPMTKWLLFGSLIKAGSWAISYVFLAKGDGKTFLFNEMGINIINIPLYLLGYHYYGLLGIGYAFTACYVIYFSWVAIVALKKYGIGYSATFWKVLSIVTVLILAFLLSEPLFKTALIRYVWGGICIAVVSVYALFELKKRLV